MGCELTLNSPNLIIIPSSYSPHLHSEPKAGYYKLNTISRSVVTDLHPKFLVREAILISAASIRA